MSRIVSRTWMAPGGWNGPRWSRATVNAFRRLMEAASQRRPRQTRLVLVWDDGRDAVCWYDATACREELNLRDQCRALFGTRERREE